jgi:hypothetical protein
VFGPHFASGTWTAWLAFLAALFGLPMTDEQLKLFQSKSLLGWAILENSYNELTAPRRPAGAL